MMAKIEILTEEELLEITGAGQSIDRSPREAKQLAAIPERAKQPNPPDGGSGAHPEVDADVDDGSGGGPIDFGT